MLYIVINEEEIEDLLNSVKSGFFSISHKKDNLFSLSDGDDVWIPVEFQDRIKDIVLKYDPLIYGKDQTEKIVAIEAGESELYLYIEESPGVIKTEIRPFKRWILGHIRPRSEYIELDGNLQYKYLREYSTEEDYNNSKKFVYRDKENLYTIYDGAESAMVRYGYTLFKGMKVEDVSVLSFDIETSGLKADADDAIVFLISNTYKCGDIVERKLFAVDEYKNEGEMLKSWIAWVNKKNPSVLIGHNVVSFDLPYLNTRAEFNNLPGLRLGRDGSRVTFNEKPSKIRYDGSQSYDYYKCTIIGRQIVDTWVLSMKYDIGRNFPNYKLKGIIKYLGYEKEDRSFWDFSENNPMDLYLNLKDNKEGWDKFKRYCSEDSDDALKLYELMVPNVFYWSQSCPRSLQNIVESASGSQLNAMMVRGYLQLNHSLPQASEKVPFQGATSMGIPGIYQNVIGVDFASLYPSIIRQYRIYDKEKDPQAHLLKITEFFTLERLKNKKLAKETENQYYKDLEQSQKVAINSLYGFMGSSGLLFNSPECAAEVTRKGRELFNKVLVWATGYDDEYWKTKMVAEEEVADESQF
jgi:DNA polymerase, archaea type